jgi:AcrR family transcriptional regulator
MTEPETTQEPAVEQPLTDERAGDEPTTDQPTARVPRRRDAGDTRARLLQAATELFAERGFDRATVRDIGGRAGVDAALIARYFGGKTQLYIATLANAVDPNPADLLVPARLSDLLDRAARRRPGPILQAAVRVHDDDTAQAAAMRELRQRIIDPLYERFVREGRPDPALRAELVAAAYIGINLARSVGALEELAQADSDRLLPMVQAVLAGGLDTPVGPTEPEAIAPTEQA